MVGPGPWSLKLWYLVRVPRLVISPQVSRGGVGSFKRPLSPVCPCPPARVLTEEEELS